MYTVSSVHYSVYIIQCTIHDTFIVGTYDLGEGGEGGEGRGGGGREGERSNQGRGSCQGGDKAGAGGGGVRTFWK